MDQRRADYYYFGTDPEHIRDIMSYLWTVHQSVDVKNEVGKTSDGEVLKN